mmetsp:Transcript_42511/g.102400  ORF Transcript_42511/g.102400 Transcript_42511/m.102400 type:complete len:113 (-) Transcript_42511:367-705(-)
MVLDEHQGESAAWVCPWFRSVCHLSLAFSSVLMVAPGRVSVRRNVQWVRLWSQDFGLRASCIWCKRLGRRNLSEFFFGVAGCACDVAKLSLVVGPPLVCSVVHVQEYPQVRG